MSLSFMILWMGNGFKCMNQYWLTVYNYRGKKILSLSLTLQFFFLNSFISQNCWRERIIKNFTHMIVSLNFNKGEMKISEK